VVSDLVVVGVVALVASTLQAIAGFGFALLAVPAMAAVVEPRVAVVVCTALGLITSAVQSTVERRHTDWLLVRRLTWAALAGMPVGFVVFLTVSDTVLRVLLALGVSSAVVLLARGVDLRHVGPSFDRSMGFVSGVLSTSLATNGPPLVFGLQARHLPANRFRATLATVFVISGAVSLGAFIVAGRVEGTAAAGVVVGLPAIAVGVLAGRRLARAVQPQKFRLVVLTLMVGAAASALASALLR
jgi:uncharacterized membrane protein YfcA